MHRFLRNLADVLDFLAAVGAVGAVYIFMTGIADVDTAPVFMQVAVLALTVAVVPYCMAGAVHRLWVRVSTPTVRQDD